MTRRIAAAILLVTWVTLLAAGVAAYWGTRLVLLADLDASIVDRARRLPEVLGLAPGTGEAGLPPGDRYVVRDVVGRTVARPAVDPPSVPVDRVDVRRAATAVLADGRRVRSLTLAVVAGRGGGPATPLVITYSASADRVDALLGRLAVWLSVTGAACGLVAVAAAVRISRLALRPLTAAAEAIETIDDRSLDRRLDASRVPVELRPMVERLNTMLARLEAAFARRRRFLADVSHELRTPVAALVTTIEVALRRPRDAAALTDALRTSMGEASALRHLVEQLTRQARSESGSWDEAAEAFDALPLLHACADAAAAVGAERQVQVRRHLPDRLPVRTQPGRLRSIVTNLLANAVEYNRDGGHVDLRCDVDAAGLSITVADDGPGIPADLLPRLFEPFTRGTATPGAGHLGLGLSILQGHVRSLGGLCEVQSAVNAGARFRVQLPHDGSAADPAEAATGPP